VRQIHLLLIFCLFAGQVFAQKLTQDIANYKIRVVLDPEEKTLTGDQVVEWLNTSPVDVDELHFHLYMNAFRDENSSFMKESGGKLRSDKIKEDGFGNIYFTSIQTEKGVSVLGKLRYIQPDDNNKEDRTVAAVKLPMPIKSGERIKLTISFKVKLPKVFARTGFGRDDFYMIGQWFPKIGVFEQNQQGNWVWNCHQFHANSEFYADFGKYNVDIVVPRRFKVGATGQQIRVINLNSDFKMVSFEAYDVHDFAWTASPNYIVFETKHNGILLRAFMQPEHAGQHRRYFDAVIHSIDYFEEVMGKYPYPVLTLVDPPFHSSGAGGMEYPMFITCGSYWGLGSWQHYPEIVTVHEFGHQYFQGMLASNEFEQSFMDEGFNQYMEGRIMDEYYGKGSQLNLFGFKVGDTQNSRASYVGMEFPEVTSIDTKSWEYPKGTYGIMTYTKTATVLKTLENYLGREKMDKVLKSYFETYRFRHPKLKDFEQLLNRITGEDYSWFIEQTFRQSYSCDYSVDSVKNEKGAGRVFISNKGKLYLPLDIEIIFADGSLESIRWDGRDPDKELVFEKEISAVRLDPLNKNLLDLNLINNSYSIDNPDRFVTKYSIKVLFWLQHLITSFLFWIG
jgi:hypothetical protein